MTFTSALTAYQYNHMSLRSLGSLIFSWAAMTMARRFRPAIRMGLDASSTARQVPYDDDCVPVVELC